MTSARPLLFPAALQAPGTAGAPFEPLIPLAELPAGRMQRLTRGDLDILLVHCDAGVAAIEDRCPHMSAPLSLGAFEGCVVRCPLHRGSFDLRDGGVVVFPTTGGLTADGEQRSTWMPEGADPKEPVGSQGPGARADARASAALLPRAHPGRPRRGRAAAMTPSASARNRLLRWLPALAWMVVIFLLSSRSGLHVSEDAAVDRPIRILAHLATFAFLAPSSCMPSAAGGPRRLGPPVPRCC